MVYIKAAQLGYLAFVLLPLIKLYVLGRAFNVALQGPALLRLWRLGLVRHLWLHL